MKHFIYLIKNLTFVNILTKSSEIHSLLFNNHHSNHHVRIRNRFYIRHVHIRIRNMWLRSLLLVMETRKVLKVKHVQC